MPFKPQQRQNQVNCILSSLKDTHGPDFFQYFSGQVREPCGMATSEATPLGWVMKIIVRLIPESTGAGVQSIGIGVNDTRMTWLLHQHTSQDKTLNDHFGFSIFFLMTVWRNLTTSFRFIFFAYSSGVRLNWSLLCIEALYSINNCTDSRSPTFAA